MRKITLIMGVLLVASFLPAMNVGAFPVDKFEGTIVLDEDDAVVNPVSFDAEGALPAGLDVPGLSEGEHDSKDSARDEAPVWLSVEPGEDPIDITLDASGLVVGSVDVYEYGSQSDHPNTPRCVWHAVSPLYPDGEAASISYFLKLRSLALERHTVDAGVAGGDAQIQLPGGDHHYLVVIDARAGTGLYGDGAQLDYTLDSTSTFDAQQVSTEELPMDPIELADNAPPCVSDGPPLPPVADQIPELTGSLGAQELLDASLP